MQYYSTLASAPDGDETEVWFQKWQRKCVTDRNDKALSTAGETMKWKAFPLSLSNMYRVSYAILLEHALWAQLDDKQRRVTSFVYVH